MKAERTPAGQGPLVQGFAGRAFRVDGVTYDAVLLTPEAAMAWTAPALAALGAADFAPLLALRPAPEFILLGTLALRTGKVVKWDAESMAATNAPDAQPFIQGIYRKGWELPL